MEQKKGRRKIETAPAEGRKTDSTTHYKVVCAKKSASERSSDIRFRKFDLGGYR